MNLKYGIRVVIVQAAVRVEVIGGTPVPAVLCRLRDPCERPAGSVSSVNTARRGDLFEL